MESLIDAAMNDAAIVGEIDGDILAMPCAIAFGQSREDKNFRNVQGSFEQFLSSITKFERGPKNGKCILQGELVDNGQRTANRMRAAHVMIIDIDNGISLETVANNIERSGLFAFCWTTHSHMKGETEIAEGALMKFKRKARSAGPVDTGLVQEYLAEEKAYDAAIIRSVRGYRREQTTNGMMFIVEHDPMPRSRVLLKLAAPFVFAEQGDTFGDAVRLWKEKYKSVCALLDLPFDESCTDPSRLMYTPRVARDADLAEHSMAIFAGAPLDLNTLSTDENQVDDNAFIRFAGDKRERVVLQTPGLMRFLKEHANDFEAASWLSELDPDNVKSEADGKIEFRCPNFDNHTEQKEDDRGFAAWNASSGGLSGFHLGCLHNTCKHASGGDRAWYLDKLCALYGVGVDDLLHYCPTAAERAREQAQAKGSLEEALEALTEQSTRDDVKAVLAILAKADPIEHGRVLKRIKAATKIEMPVLRELLDDMLPQKEVERVSHAVPSDLATATTIWMDWEPETIIDAAKARMAWSVRNQKTSLFTRLDGERVRVGTTGTGIRVTEMASKHWNAEIIDRLRFREVGLTGEKGVFAPGNLAPYFESCDDLDLPPLNGISSVPLVGPDGRVHADHGYDPQLGIFIQNGFKHEPLPDVVAPAHIEAALGALSEAIKDFPFTDCFEGEDSLPIKDGEPDGRGYRQPNWQRGVSSRVNALAMILQPHLRHFIDGPCPSYHLDKASPGTGATYLADVPSIIAEGVRATAQPLPNTEDEFRKTIAATFKNGAPIVFIDNVNTRLDSGAFAGALTSGFYQDRVLGETAMVRFAIRSMVMLAGNNMELSDELTRRMVPIRLDAATPNPAMDRKAGVDFDHFPLQSWLIDNRSTLVWACQVLVKAWVDAGMPRGGVGVSDFHSFDDWCGVMCGLFETVGVEGFLANRNAYIGVRNDDNVTDRMLVEKIVADHGAGLWGARDVMVMAVDPVSGETLLNIDGKDEHQQVRWVTKYLTKNLLGRTYDVAMDEHTLRKHLGDRADSAKYVSTSEGQKMVRVGISATRTATGKKFRCSLTPTG